MQLLRKKFHTEKTDGKILRVALRIYKIKNKIVTVTRLFDGLPAAQGFFVFYKGYVKGPMLIGKSWKDMEKVLRKSFKYEM